MEKRALLWRVDQFLLSKKLWSVETPPRAQGPSMSLLTGTLCAALLYTTFLLFSYFTQEGYLFIVLAIFAPFKTRDPSAISPQKTEINAKGILKAITILSGIGLILLSFTKFQKNRVGKCYALGISSSFYGFVSKAGSG